GGGGRERGPEDAVELGGELGVARQLELPHRGRLHPVRPPDPLHRRNVMPPAPAITVAVQWVVSPGGSVSVRATVRSRTASGSGGCARAGSCLASGHRCPRLRNARASG